MSYHIKNADVEIHAKELKPQAYALPRSFVTIDKSTRAVHVYPITHCDIKNKRVYDEDNIKIMSRHDDPSHFMLYCDLRLDEDHPDGMNILDEIGKLDDALHALENYYKELTGGKTE